MTDEQIAIAKALGRCGLPVATEKKRFIQNMKFLAENSPHEDLTDKQDRYLRDLAFQFRRQLPIGLVINAQPNKSYSVLQWMAPELVKAGLLANEPWVEESCARAIELFAKDGMHKAAVLLSAMHQRAIDYLLQAPIIALAATRGMSLTMQEDRLAVGQAFKDRCTQGIKLKDLMRAYRVEPVLRAISGSILSPAYWPALRILKAVNPSTVAQAIPRRPADQESWLSTLLMWATRMERNRHGASNGTPYAEWAIKNVPSDLGARVAELVDYISATLDPRNEMAPFNERWTLNRAMREMEAWHARLAAETNEDKFKRNFSIGWNDPVDYAPLPVRHKIDDYEFVALRSGADLYAEGAAMRHCVASYAGHVVSGHSRIYGIRKNDVRVATMEITLDGGELIPVRRIDAIVSGYVSSTTRWRVVQVKAYCNAVPSNSVWVAVEKFIANANEKCRPYILAERKEAMVT